MLMPVNIYYSC